MRHNRILALAAVLALLLAVPALAAAGGADDPLISRSHAEGTFRGEVGAALDAAAAAAVLDAGGGARADGLSVVALAPGDTVTLRDGQQLVLLSGGVRLAVGSGNLVNATLGRGSTGGDARTGHRYVVWGGASVTATAGAKGAAVAASPKAQTALTEAPPTPTPARRRLI